MVITMRVGIYSHYITTIIFRDNMSSKTNFLDISKKTQIQSGQVIECNESVTDVGEFQQHSFAKNSFSHYQSNNEQYYSTDSRTMQHLVPHASLAPKSSYYYEHEEILHTGLTVMILAPEKYKDVTKAKMLFEPFHIPYKSSRKELLNEIMEQRRNKTDKSGQLDEDECSIALLTLFKYVEVERYPLNADILLPIVYEHVNDRNGEYYTVTDFRTLIIDTLAEHIRFQTFHNSGDLTLQLMRKMSKETERISNKIEATRTDDLQRSSDESPNPFSLLTVLLHIGYLVLFLFGLPIVAFLVIFKSFPRKNSKEIKTKIPQLLIILLSIIGGLVACIVYLAIINLVLFHIHHDTNVAWHVSSLEVYWPFALITGIVCIAYVYGSPFAMNSDYKKNQKMQQNYDEAALDFLKHKAVVNMPSSSGKYQSMTVAEIEQNKKDSPSTKNESSDNRNKSFVIKIKVIGLIVVLGVAVVRACVPTIYRKYNPRYTYPNTTKPFQLKLVLQEPANNNPYGVAQKSGNEYFLDLRHQRNLELFVAQLRHVTKLKDTLPYQLAMASMGGGVIFTLILGIVAIIQLIYYQPGGLPTLTTLLGIIDICILMILVIIFLCNIVIINSAVENVEVLLLRTKKEVFVLSTKRETHVKEWNIKYLSAMTEQFAVDKSTFIVTIFGFVIDKPLIMKAALTMIGSLVSQMILFVKKKANLENE
ncbi:unnamed protein product [Rotaria sordida]|uniref:Uncharacterized protein n=1 Tax=Rotaria sordida TaxID=392033 RepID=A0A814CSZ6_9BILA|nr:unnamed protein product [Rotaria sordida]